MEYLAIYLILGILIDAGFMLVDIKSGTWKGLGSVGYMLTILPVWPIYSIIGIYLILDGRARRCAWCGHVSINDEEIKAHILVCELHPMRKEIEQVRKELEEMTEERNEAIGQLSAHFYSD